MGSQPGSPAGSFSAPLARGSPDLLRMSEGCSGTVAKANGNGSVPGVLGSGRAAHARLGAGSHGGGTRTGGKPGAPMP